MMAEWLEAASVRPVARFLIARCLELAWSATSSAIGSQWGVRVVHGRIWRRRSTFH